MARAEAATLLPPSYRTLPSLPPPPLLHKKTLPLSQPQTLISFCCPYSSADATTATLTTYNLNHQIWILCCQGDLSRALQLIPHEPHPKQRTFEILIVACRDSNDPSYASLIHRSVMDSDLAANPFLSTRLIQMYSRFGLISLAREVLDVVPSIPGFRPHDVARAEAQFASRAEI